MTTISIITQTSMYDIFGEIGCVVFGVSVFISIQLLVVGGLGMAVFRFICVENLMKQIDREYIIKIIHLVEFVIVIGTTTLRTFGIYYSGWEKVPLYQFYKDYGLAKADIFSSYHKYETEEFGKF